VSDSHEGLIVSDGIRQYRIVNGFRVHLEKPSPELLQEILEDALQLQLHQGNCNRSTLPNGYTNEQR
jgi:hypothetical protein